MLRVKKRLPAAKHVRFVLCEDARQETSGKATLVGVYPGEIIIVHRPRPPEGTKAVAALSSVCLVFFVAGGSGGFEVGVRITAPDGTIGFEQKVGSISIGDGKTATIVGQIRPFLVSKFGSHTATLMINGRQYPFEFTIREGVMPAPAATNNY